MFGSNGRRNYEAEQTQRMSKISTLKMQLEKFEAESLTFNQQIKDKQQALLKGREEYDKLRQLNLEINIYVCVLNWF